MPEFDLTYSPQILEAVLVGDSLVYSGPRAPLEKASVQPKFSYAFYDTTTGEVWARRICVEGVSVWIYVPRPYPWLLIGYEEEQGTFPGELARFILEAKLNDNEFLSHSGLEGTPDGGFRLRQDLLNPDAD